jgi:Domain of unknown function (DUF4760)
LADDWIAIGTLLLFGATLLGAGFVFWELRSGHEETKEANSRTKKQATVDFYTQTLSRIVARETELPHDRDGPAIRFMLKDLKDNPYGHGNETLKDKIHSYLAFWELTAVAIKQEVFDQELFQAMLKTHFLQLEEHYRPFIEDARNEYGANGKELYVQLQDLADSWRRPATTQRRGIQRFLAGGQRFVDVREWRRKD